MATSEPVLEVDRSQSFTNSLLQNLRDMKTQGELTDLTIIAANVRIPCHCNVMAAASEHVRFLVTGPMSEDQEIQLNFEGVCVQRIVDYCYTGKISIELSAAKPYLRIAEYFHLTELKEQIDEFLCEHVSPKTCIGWYSTAKELSLDALEKTCRVVMTVRWREVTECGEFHQMPVREMIEYGKLVNDANTKLEACAKWASSNAVTRSEHFLELLSHIQLDQCSPRNVQRVLQSWKPIWPNYNEVQQALKPRALAVHRAPGILGQSRLLLLGGFTQGGKLNDKVWKVDLMDGSRQPCTTLDDRAAGRHRAGYCTTPEKLFVVGGIGDKSQPSSDCRALAIKDSQWEVWPDTEDPIASTSAVCVDDHIYTLGGVPSPKAVHCLNLTTKTWSRCRDMPVGNIYPILAAILQKIYIIFNTEPYNEKFKASSRVAMYCFDTSTLAWTSFTSLPASIKDTCRAVAVSAGQYIYLVGGRGKLCARYSTNHDKWTMLEPPKVVHQGAGAVHMDGEIMLCGGGDGNLTAHDIIEVYNIGQNSWKVHSIRMPARLMRHHCAVCDEAAYNMVV